MFYCNHNQLRKKNKMLRVKIAKQHSNTRINKAGVAISHSDGVKDLPNSPLVREYIDKGILILVEELPDKPEAKTDKRTAKKSTKENDK